MWHVWICFGHNHHDLACTLHVWLHGLFLALHKLHKAVVQKKTRYESMMVKPWAHLPGDSKEYAIFTYECGDVNLVKTMGQTGGKPPTNLKANRICFFRPNFLRTLSRNRNDRISTGRSFFILLSKNKDYWTECFLNLKQKIVFWDVFSQCVFHIKLFLGSGGSASKFLDNNI